MGSTAQPGASVASVMVQPVRKKGVVCLCSKWAKERGGNFNKKKEFKSICNSQILMFYVFMGNSIVNGSSSDVPFLQKKCLFHLIPWGREG